MRRKHTVTCMCLAQSAKSTWHISSLKTYIHMYIHAGASPPIHTANIIVLFDTYMFLFIRQYEGKYCKQNVYAAHANGLPLRFSNITADRGPPLVAIRPGLTLAWLYVGRYLCQSGRHAIIAHMHALYVHTYPQYIASRDHYHSPIML